MNVFYNIFFIDFKYIFNILILSWLFLSILFLVGIKNKNKIPTFIYLCILILFFKPVLLILSYDKCISIG